MLGKIPSINGLSGGALILGNHHISQFRIRENLPADFKKKETDKISRRMVSKGKHPTMECSISDYSDGFSWHYSDDSDAVFQNDGWFMVDISRTIVFWGFQILDYPNLN